MLNIIEDIISTRKLRKYKFNSPKNIRDHLQIFERIRENGIKMDFVSAYIDREFGTKVKYLSLLSIAGNLSKELDLKLDRLAKRNRNALLCWYAENWDKIQPHIKEQKTCLDISSEEDISSPVEIQKEECHTESVNTVVLRNCMLIDPSDLNQLLNFH
ncbi:hypothetical protein TVAG_383580 [Trichomonas vaginalis G3]|uniref:Uncharacterized protein n=1 Tax=Trichomonas vaginalis (strain ATCC PRA-98 / G3) TaxID=412133 RepID=A2EZ67_TRIV3|nr:hypothetical protein TVAGG3_0459130 [Trichomonas vaginalis G3]EAY02055.1 hypothetical protein TVAG_383580 [Trichomonas vaginalis G3]KAI5514286.1 hypothetical protein TVAGG3_0459130 [Trichomonas vaginalis G3]|eukprot:XP_001330509.1 hypothetical protein [Trichomonas vaginalis G3]